MSDTIFTIGYEQAAQPALVTALRDAGVEVLADIRYLPLSRRRGLRSAPAGLTAHCRADARRPRCLRSGRSHPGRQLSPRAPHLTITL